MTRPRLRALQMLPIHSFGAGGALCLATVRVSELPPLALSFVDLLKVFLWQDLLFSAPIQARRNAAARAKRRDASAFESTVLNYGTQRK